MSEPASQLVSALCAAKLIQPYQLVFVAAVSSLLLENHAF